MKQQTSGPASTIDVNGAAHDRRGRFAEQQRSEAGVRLSSPSSQDAVRDRIRDALLADAWEGHDDVVTRDDVERIADVAHSAAQPVIEAAVKDDYPALQTDAPIEYLSLATYVQSAYGLAQQFRDGELLVDPPYQRPSVWTRTQQRLLVRSWREGVPIPAIVVNDRGGSGWRKIHGDADYEAGRNLIAVVDGRQRMEAVRAWFDGDLDVPASWFADDEVASTHETPDGPYVTWNSLTTVGRTRMKVGGSPLPVTMAKLASERDEARLYLTLNTGGVAQSDDHLANASQYT